MHPIFRLVIALSFHPQLVNALMTSCITNVTNFVMRHSIVTPKRLGSQICVTQFTVTRFKKFQTSYVNLTMCFAKC